MGIFDFFKRAKKQSKEERLGEQIEFARIEAEFPSLFPKKPLIYSKIYNDNCQFRGCKSKINSFTRYICQYCHNQFCEKHRLPEDHSCKHPALPEYMRKTGQKNYRIEGKDNSKREVVSN